LHVVFVSIMSAPTSSSLADRALTALTLHGRRIKAQQNLQARTFYYHYFGIIPADPTVDAQPGNRSQLTAGLCHVDYKVVPDYLGEGELAFRLNNVFLANQWYQSSGDFQDRDVDLGLHFIWTITGNLTQLDPEIWREIGYILDPPPDEAADTTSHRVARETFAPQSTGPHNTQRDNSVSQRTGPNNTQGGNAGSQSTDADNGQGDTDMPQRTTRRRFRLIPNLFRGEKIADGSRSFSDQAPNQ
jgi:hypothetical protein